MFQPRCGILRLAWGERPGVAFHFFLGACLSGGRVGFFRPASVFRKRPITFHLRVVLLWPVGGDRQSVNASLQLSATDVSAQTTMKGAAKCDKHCDLQNSVNQQELERILCFRDTPESASPSVSISSSPESCVHLTHRVFIVRQSREFRAFDVFNLLRSSVRTHLQDVPWRLRFCVLMLNRSPIESTHTVLLKDMKLDEQTR